MNKNTYLIVGNCFRCEREDVEMNLAKGFKVGNPEQLRCRGKSRRSAGPQKKTLLGLLMYSCRHCWPNSSNEKVEKILQELQLHVA
mgnify:CR=1 FL=1